MFMPLTESILIRVVMATLRNSWW